MAKQKSGAAASGSKKYRFRVIAGKHVGAGGIRYTKGQVIESEKDLRKVFPNSFEKVSDDTPLSKGEPTKVVNTETPTNQFDDGAHHDDAERTQIAEKSRRDIAHDKADEPLSEEEREEEAARAQELEDEENEESSGEEEGEEESLGEDVTSKFPEAKEAGFKVFKDGKKHFITEDDNPTKPLNKKALSTSEEVKKQIKKLTK